MTVVVAPLKINRSGLNFIDVVMSVCMQTIDTLRRYSEWNSFFDFNQNELNLNDLQECLPN